MDMFSNQEAHLSSEVQSFHYIDVTCWIICDLCEVSHQLPIPPYVSCRNPKTTRLILLAGPVHVQSFVLRSDFNSYHKWQNVGREVNLRKHLVQVFHLIGEETRSRGEGVCSQVSDQWTVELFLFQDPRPVTRKQTIFSGSSIASYNPIVLRCQSRMFTWASNWKHLKLYRLKSNSSSSTILSTFSQFAKWRHKPRRSTVQNSAILRSSFCFPGLLCPLQAPLVWMLMSLPLCCFNSAFPHFLSCLLWPSPAGGLCSDFAIPCLSYDTSSAHFVILSQVVCMEGQCWRLVYMYKWVL